MSLRLVGGGVIALAAGALLTLTTLIALLGASFAATPGGFQTSSPSAPSQLALADIPRAYLRMYVEAATRFGVDWAVLAAIGRAECDHGRDPDPSCTKHGALNSAGAGGPMQFLVSTWRSYGLDGDGDGVADTWDPADAIASAAHYLRAEGAPGDYARAIYAYNHASWYVHAILALAASYRAAGIAATSVNPINSSAPLRIVRAPAARSWLAPLAGSGLRCDARIVPDVEYLLARFGMRATACFAASGHALGGEHPLGLALDAVPVDGDWSRALSLASAFGWQPSCGPTGCAGRLREPLRFVGYNGYPGHGDPAHAGANAHIHLSWLHAPAAPLTQAQWVDVFSS